jgi:hypothetical protein
MDVPVHYSPALEDLTIPQADQLAAAFAAEQPAMPALPA